MAAPKRKKHFVSNFSLSITPSTEMFQPDPKVIVPRIERNKDKNAYEYLKHKRDFEPLKVCISYCPHCRREHPNEPEYIRDLHHCDVLICRNCYRVYTGLLDYSTSVEFSMEPFNTIADLVHIIEEEKTHPHTKIELY